MQITEMHWILHNRCDIEYAINTVLYVIGIV